MSDVGGFPEVAATGPGACSPRRPAGPRSCPDGPPWHPDARPGSAASARKAAAGPYSWVAVAAHTSPCTGSPRLTPSRRLLGGGGGSSPIPISGIRRCSGCRPVAAPAGTPPSVGSLPSVSLIVAAHDEEASIARWVRSALALDYPRDRLEVVVVSDGSTDRTREWATKAGADLVLEVPRGGKVAALNAAVGGREARCWPSPTRTPPGSRMRSGAWWPASADPRSATSAASFASRGRAARTRRGSTGATRWRAVPSSPRSPASPRATGRSTRCAARPTSRSSRPAARTSPSRTSSPSEGGARCSSRRGRPGADGGDARLEFLRKRRMLAGAWATMLRHGMLSPRGYGPAYAFEIYSHRGLRYAGADPAPGRAGDEHRPAR